MSEEPFEYRSLDPVVEIGAWANVTRVLRGRDEITIDYFRTIPDDPEPVLVGRMLLAPFVAAQLRDQIDQMWRDYTPWEMPESSDG